MVFMSLREVFDILIMTIAVGFIFMDIFKKPTAQYEPLHHQGFKWHDFFFAAMVTAPGIILHELGHKFVALAFGLTAAFKAAYTFLGIGIALKLLSAGFIFFVPAYVSISGPATHLQSALTAAAGPLTNLVIFLLALIVLKTKKLSHNWLVFWTLTKQINIFLFIFNMLPFFFFDGAKVFSGLANHFGLF